MSEIKLPALLNAYDTYVNNLATNDTAQEIKSVHFYIKGNEIKCIPINEKMTEKGFKKISTVKVVDALYKDIVEEKLEKPPSENLKTFVQVLHQSLKSKKRGRYSAKNFFSRVQHLFTIHHFKTSQELMRLVHKQIR